MLGRAFHLLCAVAAGLVLFLCAGLARADESGGVPIAVLAIQTDDAYDQADALTQAIRKAIKNSNGWSLQEGDHALEVLALTMNCQSPPDAICQARIGDHVKADRYVWGMLAKKGTNVQGALHLWVRGKGTTEFPLDYSANVKEAADPGLEELVKKAFESVTGGPPTGGLKVKAGKVNGQVFSDSKAIGGTINGEGVFQLPIGTHKIMVRATGYSDAVGTVTIKPGATAEISLTPEVGETSAPTDWQKVGGFISLGAGLAFATVGIVSSVQVYAVQNDDEFTKFRQPFLDNGREDACDLAREGDARGLDEATYQEGLSTCDKAETFEVLQLVFYPLAGVAGGLGIILLATADWGDDKPKKDEKEKASWDLRPRFGPTGADLAFIYRW